MKRNNDMKHLSYHYIVGLLAALLSATFVGCTDEADEPVADGRTATIRLDIPMLEAATRITTPTEAQEKAINQLRVIILSQGATSINRTFTADDLAGGSITIDNVPVGQVQMYVIANEASLGKDYSDLTKLQKDVITVNETRKVLIEDESRSWFPKRGSEMDFTTKGLPMSWMNKNLTIEPPTDTPQEIKVELVRTVAKLNITMNNALKDDITINGMSFGAFFGDCLYLFHETNLDVPDDTDYAGMSYTNGISISIEGYSSATLVLYIYPSFAWTDGSLASPYTIGFTTAAGGIYTPQAFVNNYGALNSIARNTQVNISATLRTDTHIEIDFEVVPWDNYIVDVPPFN